MKIITYRFWLVLSFAVVMVGCDRTARMDERERNYRIVTKAYEMSNQGDNDSAIALFEKALESYPNLARPHLDLALLLQDQKQDYVRAIYHYSRYLELRPGTEKDVMIKDRIRQAEREFVGLHTVSGAAAGVSVSDLTSENSALKEKNASLVSRIEALEKDLNDLRELERQRYKAEVVGADGVAVLSDVLPSPQKPDVVPDDVRSPVRAAVVSPPATVRQPPSGSTSDPSERPLVINRKNPPIRAANPRDVVVPAEDESLVRTYTVRLGDSLSKIAYKVYGDATQWRRIQNANRETMGDSVNVKVGQLLVIP